MLPTDYKSFSMLIGGASFTTKVDNLPIYAAAAAKSLQSCPTLCDPVDSSPPGPPVPGILQARILAWVAISFYKATITLIPKPEKNNTQNSPSQASAIHEP